MTTVMFLGVLLFFLCKPLILMLILPLLKE